MTGKETEMTEEAIKKYQEREAEILDKLDKMTVFDLANDPDYDIMNMFKGRGISSSLKT